MATIRKRKSKWEVQIRRKGRAAISRSFHVFKDAEEWARHMEVLADRGDLPADPAALRSVTLGQLVERYRDAVSPKKRTYKAERLVLNAFMRHPICRRPISDITTAHFAAYRDERLRDIKPASVKRALVPIHNMYEVARSEWYLPIRENPLSKLKFGDSDQRRERRLRPGELEALVEAAKLTRNKFVLPIVTLALETAMRRGEMLAIRKQHINLDKRTLLREFLPSGVCTELTVHEPCNVSCVACTRFRRHRVRCFDGTGGESWRDGSLHASSSLRLCG